MKGDILRLTRFCRSGCSLGIRDWRIVWLLLRILGLMCDSLWIFFIQTWSLFHNILRLRYTFLLLLEFLMKTLIDENIQNEEPKLKANSESTIYIIIML